MRALATGARASSSSASCLPTWGGRRPRSHDGGSGFAGVNARHCPQGRRRLLDAPGIAACASSSPPAARTVSWRPRRLAGAARRSAPAAARARRARLSPRTRRRGRPHGPDRRGRHRHGARADPVRSAQRDPGGSGRAEGRLSAAGGARLLDRARQGHADGPRVRARFRAAGAHRRLCARAQPAAEGRVQCRRAVFRPGHAVEDMRDVFSYDIVTDGIRVLVRARACCVRRDAGGAARSFHPSPTRGRRA